MTGVIPRGAQVRRVTGSSETPDSSQKTMTALRRRAFLPDPRPVALHPPLDGLLVALDGPAGGALQPPAQPAAQQLPHMTGVVGDPGDLLDHRGDARKGPVVGVEAVRLGALSERLADRLKLSIGPARSVPGRSGTAQRLRPARAPAPMPAADVLPRDAESAGDLGLGAAGGEQLAGLETDTFEGLAVTQTTGVAAVSGWSHAAMLPGQPQSCHRKGRTSLTTRKVRCVTPAPSITLVRSRSIGPVPRWSNKLTPPPSRTGTRSMWISSRSPARMHCCTMLAAPTPTSLSPATAWACSRALSRPSVTKVNGDPS